MVLQSETLDYAAIFDCLPRGIVVVSQVNHCVYTNDRASDIFHFSSARSFKQASLQKIEKHVKLFSEQGKEMSFGKVFSFSRAHQNIYHEIFRLYFPKLEEERWISLMIRPINGTKQPLALFSIVDLTREKKQEKALQLFNQISAELSSSLSYNQQLKKFAKLIVPEFADWCAIDMVTEEGNVERQLWYDADSSQQTIAQHIDQTFHSKRGEKQHGVGKVIYSGSKLFYPRFNRQELASLKKTELSAYVSKLKVCSLVIIPLIARSKTMGAITFAWSQSGKHYDDLDVQFLESVCQRVALLVDNVRLLQQANEEVELQKAIQYKLIDKDMTLKIALKAGQMGVWDWDLQTHKIHWSDGLEKLHGLKKGEFKGTLTAYKELVHSQDLPQLEAKLEKSIKQQLPFETEFRIVHPDQSIHWMSSKGKVIKNGEGTVVRMVGVGIDITDRKIQEESLKESEHKFKAIFETSLDGILITDSTGKIVDANQAAENIFQLPKNSLVRKELSDLICLNNGYSFREVWELIQENGQNRGEFQLQRDEETYIEFTGRAEILPNRTLLMLRDITERKAEQVRQQHFLSIASHELKNPLASIKAFVQLLQRYLKNTADEKVLHYLEKIDSKSDSLAHLINDLLDITRIRQDKLELYLEFFSIDELVKEVVEDLQMTTDTHRVLVQGKTDQEVMGDKNRIAQVIHNLVGNAIKYSPDAKKVRISVKSSPKQVTVSIRDYGIGIPEKDLNKIFQLYYRSQNHSSDNIHGLGVGLYISSQIVKQHGGKMRIKSQVGKGSTFSFTLPLPITD